MEQNEKVLEDQKKIIEGLHKLQDEWEEKELKQFLKFTGEVNGFIIETIGKYDHRFDYLTLYKKVSFPIMCESIDRQLQKIADRNKILAMKLNIDSIRP